METLFQSQTSDFAQALSTISVNQSTNIYNSNATILKLGAALFILPFLSLFALTRINAPLLTLSSQLNNSFIPTYSVTASLQPNDELSVANHLLSKANELNGLGANTTKVHDLLDQAQHQINSVFLRDPKNSQALALQQEVSSTLALLQPQKQQLAVAALPLTHTQSEVISPASNSSQGTVTLKNGSDNQWVIDTNLKDGTQLYLVRETPNANDVIYVKSRIAGKGFLLATTESLDKDVVVTWYEIQPVNGINK